MTQSPFKYGNFAWSKFPYDEDPRAPSKDPHISLMLGTIKGDDGRELCVAVYTTTNPRSQERHFQRI